MSLPMVYFSQKEMIWLLTVTCMRNAKSGDTTSFAPLRAITRPTEKLVEIEKKNVRNMLSNGYAVPSLKKSIEQAYGILEGLNAELGLESVSQRRTRLIESLRSIERDFIEAPSSVDHEGLIQLLRNQVAEWKAFSGRAALDRYLVAA
jgi:hypothetical protein